MAKQIIVIPGTSNINSSISLLKCHHYLVAALTSLHVMYSSAPNTRVNTLAKHQEYSIYTGRIVQEKLAGLHSEEVGQGQKKVTK